MLNLQESCSSSQGYWQDILSISSILLYIAAILCFTKKQPLQDDLQFEDQSYNSDGMRPL